jgi:hypothetical protein
VLNTASAYVRQGVSDDRFVDYAGAAQAVVTSTASSDSGMFETNLREERFLPFELSGAISTWQTRPSQSNHGYPVSTTTPSPTSFCKFAIPPVRASSPQR